MSVARNVRMGMRLDNETKEMAERGSAASGCSSLTEYITALIRKDAPEAIKKHAAIEVSNQQFARFMAACEAPAAKPSKRILEAAHRLDEEGF